jgi:ABC-type transport system involved in multi-copper enzyme maturation permease subunit
MHESFVTLVRRYQGRLLSNRALLAAAAAYLLFLAGAVFDLRMQWTSASPASPDEATQLIRLLGWELFQNIGVVSYCLAVVFGASWLASDVSGGTLFSYLARPISRTRLFLAACTAATSIILAVEIVLAGAFLIVLAIAGGAPDASLALALLASILARVLALAFCATLAAWVSPAIAVAAYLAAEIATSMAFAKGVPAWLAPWSRAAVSWLPLTGLDHKIIRDAALHSTESVVPVAEAATLRLVWIVVLLWLGIVAFRRRELAPRI